MSEATLVRRGFTVLMIVAAALSGASILDNLQSRHLNAEMEARFKEKSTTVGAWAMDRPVVSEQIGMDEKKLPSYQWAEQQAGMAK